MLNDSHPQTQSSYFYIQQTSHTKGNSPDRENIIQHSPKHTHATMQEKATHPTYKQYTKSRQTNCKTYIIQKNPYTDTMQKENNHKYSLVGLMAAILKLIVAPLLFNTINENTFSPRNTLKN